MSTDDFFDRLDDAPNCYAVLGYKRQFCLQMTLQTTSVGPSSVDR